MEKEFFRYKRFTAVFIKYTVLVGFSYQKGDGLYIALGFVFLSYEFRKKNQLKTF
jgi:hypothetical protein